MSIEDARRLVSSYVTHYNAVRWHSAIGYVTPQDKLEGREALIFAERVHKLEAARSADPGTKTERRATDSSLDRLPRIHFGIGGYAKNPSRPYREFPTFDIPGDGLSDRHNSDDGHSISR